MNYETSNAKSLREVMKCDGISTLWFNGDFVFLDHNVYCFVVPTYQIIQPSTERTGDE